MGFYLFLFEDLLYFRQNKAPILFIVKSEVFAPSFI